MNSYMYSLLIWCIFFTALMTNITIGQTLTAIRKGTNDLFIQVKAPTNARYKLQESVNLSLWVDKEDDEYGPLTVPFDRINNTKRFFRPAPWAEPSPPIIIVLIGDSTMADLVNNGYWFCGWGQGIYGYFKSNVRVVNLAMPGHGTKTFLSSAECTKMVVIRPNYVLMQYGFMDEKDADLSRRTTLDEFAANLRLIVKNIHSFNGEPIFISQPVIRTFDNKGKVIQVFAERCMVMKNVAAEFKAHFINLNQMSINLYNELGESGSAFMKSDVANDIYHYSQKGALMIAGLVVNSLPNSLETYLIGIFDYLPKSLK